MLCQKNELYFILPASGGGEGEGARAEEEAAISSSSAGKKPWAFPPMQEQLSTEPLSLAGDCHLAGDAAGTVLTGRPNEDNDGTGAAGKARSSAPL